MTNEVTARGFAIIGSGGLGHEVLSSWLAGGHPPERFLGFIDAVEPDRSRLKAMGADWLGDDAVLTQLQVGTEVSVALGSESLREALTAAVHDAGLRAVSVIDPTATLGSNVEVGPGSIVLMQSSVTVHARIGAGVLINPGVRIAHDCVIGDFTSLSPGVVLCGTVTLGTGVFVGAGATICPGVTIGDRARIGAGAVVLHDVEPAVTVVGVPARPTSVSAPASPDA